MKILNVSLVAAIAVCLCTQVAAQLPQGSIRAPASALPSYLVIHNRVRSSVELNGINGVMNFQPKNIHLVPVNINTPHTVPTIKELRRKILLSRTPFPKTSNQPEAPINASSIRQLITVASGDDPGYTSKYGAGVEITKANFPTLTVFDFNSSNMFAGQVVQGKNDYIQGGHLVFLGISRSGGTVQIDSATLKPGSPVTEHVGQATNAALDTARNDLQNSAFDPDQAATTTCQYESVTSSSDASYKAGLSFGYGNTVKLNNMFSSIDTSKSNHELIQCQEAFYTLSFTPDPAPDGIIGLDSFFDPKLSVGTAAQLITMDNPPLFISNVTYGAELFVLIDSNLTNKQMEDDFNVAVTQASVSASGSINAKISQELSQMNIQLFALGGRKSARDGIVGSFTGSSAPQGLVQWLQNTQDFSASTNGYDEFALPLTYQLNYLDFGPVAETASILGDPTVGPNGYFQDSVLFFHSNGDGKNADTALDLTVHDSSGNIIGTTHIPSGLFANNQETPKFTITPLSTTYTRSAIENGWFDLQIHPTGDDTWNFTAYIAMCYVDPNTYDRNGKLTNVSTPNCPSSGGTETEVDYQYSDRVSNWRKTKNVGGVTGPDGSTTHTVRSLVQFPVMTEVDGPAK